MFLRTNDLGRTKERVASDLHRLINDTEELLRATTDYSRRRIPAATARVSKRLDALKDSLADTPERARNGYKRASAATSTFVRTNPWSTVGIVIAVGVLIGFIGTRRR